MTSMTKIAFVVALALMGAACGGSDEPDAGNGSPTGGAANAVQIKNLAFAPQNLTVAVGAVVTWTNGDDFAHTVTSGNPSDAPSGVFDGPLETNGATFTFQFKDAGTVEYYCKVHPQMTGSVVAA
ncbi:MAG TPA: plastocyanin/azurin family copper-binding protein [Actinomycetota bacterium]